MKSQLPPELITTADGSVTILLPEINEHYHSMHGAWQESMHVYIKNGLESHAGSGQVVVLEMGFGTGLNALQTWDYALKQDMLINYTTIEAHPLAKQFWEALNYHSFSKVERAADRLKQLHLAHWEEWTALDAHFKLMKHCSTIEAVNLTGQYDVAYYDAFAPRVQPELWTEEIFRKIFQAMKPEGVLVTYSASGATKRNLKAAGFMVLSLPGPPGKREMTKAIKPG